MTDGNTMEPVECLIVWPISIDPHIGGIFAYSRGVAEINNISSLNDDSSGFKLNSDDYGVINKGVDEDSNRDVVIDEGNAKLEMFQYKKAYNVSIIIKRKIHYTLETIIT